MKRFIPLIALFTFSVMWGSLIASAQEAAPKEAEKGNTLKVYYSEAIGAGEKVFQITACKKAPITDPLRCIKKGDSNSAYFDIDGQCKDSTGKVRDGELIKGCVVEGKTTKVGDSTYPEVDTALYQKKVAAGGCSDDPSKQGYVYAKTYGVVDKKGEKDDKSKWELYGTVTWVDKQKPTQDYMDTFINNSEFAKPTLEAELLHRSSLCVTYDVVQQKDKRDKQPAGKIEGTVKELYDSVDPIANELIDDSCNNDNSATSTVYDKNEYVRCSTLYRITGNSGTEIFANYVGGLYRWLAGIIGLVSVLIIVASGIQISIAGSGDIDTAKNRIIQTIVGLAILFLSGVILYAINPNFFTGS